MYYCFVYLISLFYWDAVVGYFLSLREGFEAVLVLGFILAILSKVNRKDLIPNIWAGTFFAIVVSIIIAILLNSLGSEFKGTGEAIFEGFTMLLTSTVITGSIFWANKQQVSLKVVLENNISKAVNKSGGWGLFLLAFLSVVREGIELAMFFFAAQLTSNSTQEVSGVFFGLLTATIIGWGIFSSSLNLSIKRFFQITNFVLIFFAAGLVGMSLHEFVEAGLLSPIIPSIWNLSSVLPRDSFFGQLLAALAGYQPDPSLVQVLGYVVYILFVAWMLFQTRKVGQSADKIDIR